MTFFYFSDRVALCKLWRSIVLRDEAAMEKYSNALGVKGEDTDPYTHLISYPLGVAVSQ